MFIKVILKYFLNSEDGSNKNLVLLVTPDRGLCGALVSNVLKEASNFIDSIDANYEIRVIGKKERVSFQK